MSVPFNYLMHNRFWLDGCYAMAWMGTQFFSPYIYIALNLKKILYNSQILFPAFEEKKKIISFIAEQ